MELSNLVFVAMVTVSTCQQKFYKLHFTHCIHQQNLSFKALMILELFKIMLYQNAAIIPQNLAFKQQIEKLE